MTIKKTLFITLAFCSVSMSLFSCQRAMTPFKRAFLWTRSFVIPDTITHDYDKQTQTLTLTNLRNKQIKQIHDVEQNNDKFSIPRYDWQGGTKIDSVELAADELIKLYSGHSFCFPTVKRYSEGTVILRGPSFALKHESGNEYRLCYDVK